MYATDDTIDAFSSIFLYIFKIALIRTASDTQCNTLLKALIRIASDTQCNKLLLSNLLHWVSDAVLINAIRNAINYF